MLFFFSLSFFSVLKKETVFFFWFSQSRLCFVFFSLEKKSKKENNAPSSLASNYKIAMRDLDENVEAAPCVSVVVG